MMSYNPPVQCKGCGQLIMWVKTMKGKNIPINYDKKFSHSILFDPKRMTSHFAVCPKAKLFRKGEESNNIQSLPSQSIANETEKEVFNRKEINKDLWTIVCPGPSITDYIRGDKILNYYPGHLIAVNSVVTCGLIFDYWAVNDIELFRDVLKAFTFHFRVPVLWVPERLPADLREYYSNIITIDFFKFETYLCANWDDLARSMPFGQDLDWRSYTLLSALALAVKKKAKRIMVYGADFAGSSYFSSGFENFRTNLSEERWRHEKELFDLIQAESARNGIVISREGVSS